jgi:dipeptidyl aminopeptidase/acylaminoacyl peptidase
MRACVAMVIALIALSAPAAELVPVSAFARLPQVSGFDVSPSGNRVLMFQPAGDSLHLVVIDLVAKTTRLALASDPDRFFFNWCRFANEDRILCSVRAYIKLIAGQDTVGFKWYRDGRVTVTRLFGVDHDGGHFTEMVPEKVTHPGEELVWNSQFQDRIINWLPDDDDHVLIELNRKDRMYPDVYLLDVNRNTISLVAKNSPPVSYWQATDSGKVMMGVGIQDRGPVVLVRDGRGLIDRTPPNAQYDTLSDVLGFAPDERTAYVAMDAGDGHSALYQVGASDLRTAGTILSDPEFDIFGGLIRDPRSRQPIAVVYERDHRTITWLNPEWQQRADEIGKALPGTLNVPVSSSRDGNVVVLESTSPTAVPTYYLYNVAAKKLTRIGVTHPEVPPDTIAERRPVRYAARDGMTIPAYLTLPRGGDAKRLPTIIFPHGGPYARDTDEFDYWTQYFVSRGYAVLQPNFRGSVGYGTAFMRAGYEQWGEKMQDDVIDGLDWLVAQGVADPTRVCVVGGSYGGYVALVAAYKTPEKFRCAVDFAGVADLNALAQNLYMYQFGKFSRARIQRGEALDANSPIEHVDQFGVPLLIVHGDQDRSVFIEQSADLVAALDRAGKPYQYIFQPGGDHYLSRASQRLQFFEAMDAFLRKYLGPAPETPTAG